MLLKIIRNGRTTTKDTAAEVVVYRDSIKYADYFPRAETTGALPYVELRGTPDDDVIVDLSGDEVVAILKFALAHPDKWLKQEIRKLLDSRTAHS